jgi:hypothetical protein
MRSYDTIDTEFLTKKDLAEVRRQTKELLELLLKKTGKKRKDLIEPAYRDFIYYNSDVLTDSQKKKFDKLVEYQYY